MIPAFMTFEQWCTENADLLEELEGQDCGKCGGDGYCFTCGEECSDCGGSSVKDRLRFMYEEKKKAESKKFEAWNEAMIDLDIMRTVQQMRAHA